MILAPSCLAPLKRQNGRICAGDWLRFGKESGMFSDFKVKGLGESMLATRFKFM